MLQRRASRAAPFLNVTGIRGPRDVTRRTAVIVGIYLATGLALTTLSRVLDDRLMTETGLVQSFDTGVDDERTALFTRTAAAIDLAFLEDDADLPRRFFEVRWDGVWHVPDGRQVDVFAGGDDLVAIRIDDELVLERSFAVGTHTTSARVTLDAGLHRLSVHYVQRGGGYSMNVQWAPAGESARPFEPDRLFPVSPEPEQITRNERLLSLRRLVAVFWITPPLLFLLWVGVPPVTRFGRYRMPALGRRGWAAYVSLAGDRSAAVTRDVEPHRKTWTVAGAVVVLLLFGLPLFIGLGSEDLYNDEAIYSYAVDRIVETGEWLTPESSPQTAFPGDPAARRDLFFEKPPLKFWIVALPITLGLLPHDEFGLRFWDGVFAAIAFVYVFLIGRRLVDPVCGVAAVFLLFIHSPLMFGHGLRSNVMEAALVLSYAGGIHHFLGWTESDHPSSRRVHIFCVTGWFTLGFMTKFVAAGFLPVVIGLTALAVEDWRRRLWADVWIWTAAGAVTTVLIVPWFAYEYAVYGDRFWEIIFGVHIYDRARGALVLSHNQPWRYYYDELYRQLSGVGAFGWVVAGSALWLLETIRRRWKGGVLILAWYLVPTAIISISVSKLYHYSYPFLPPVALFGAYPVSLLVGAARRLYASAWDGRTARRAWMRPATYVAAAVPLAFVLHAWPMEQYGLMLAAFSSDRRPLSAMQACLLDEYASIRETAPNTVSRVYLHLPRGGGLTHNYYYYYRAFDRWEHLASPSDADLFARLVVPSHRAVTITSEEDYTAFLARLGSPELDAEVRALATARRDPTLLTRDGASVLAEPLPPAIRVAGPGTGEALFLLPGPLGRCADVAVRSGGIYVSGG